MATTIFPSQTDYEMNRSIMVVGAHADDNEIRAGGTMLKYRALDYDTVYVMATNNMSGDVQQLQPDGTVNRLPPHPCQGVSRQRHRDGAGPICGDITLELIRNTQ